MYKEVDVYRSRKLGRLHWDGHDARTDDSKMPKNVDDIHVLWEDENRQAGWSEVTCKKHP